MPRSITKHVENMTNGSVPEGTAIYIQVRDPKAAIEAYAADNSQPFAAAADPENPTLGERLFVQSRFQVSSSDSASKRSEPAPWMQVNSTNFPTLTINALKQALKAVYDTQRTLQGLDPA